MSATLCAVSHASASPIDSDQQPQTNPTSSSLMAFGRPIILPLPTEWLQVNLSIYEPLNQLDNSLALESLAKAARFIGTVGSSTALPSRGYQNSANGVVFGVGLIVAPSQTQRLTYDMMSMTLQTIYDWFIQNWGGVYACIWKIENVDTGQMMGRGSWLKQLASSTMQEVAR